MNKKAAIELSVNFIVILVISIVVFSFGIYLMSQFFDYGNKVILERDEKHESALEDMMYSGEQVAIPFDHKRIGNKQYDKFAIGIFNTIGNANEHTFTTTVEFTQAYDPSGTEITPTLPANCDPKSWLKSATGIPFGDGIKITKTIENYEKEKFLVGVEPENALEGTYLFQVDVTYDDQPQGGSQTEQYDQSHILIVDVVY